MACGGVASSVHAQLQADLGARAVALRGSGTDLRLIGLIGPLQL